MTQEQEYDEILRKQGSRWRETLGMDVAAMRSIVPMIFYYEDKPFDELSREEIHSILLSQFEEIKKLRAELLESKVGRMNDLASRASG